MPHFNHVRMTPRSDSPMLRFERCLRILALTSASAMCQLNPGVSCASPELNLKIDSAVARGGEYLATWLVGDAGLAARPRRPFAELALWSYAYLVARDRESAPVLPEAAEYVSRWWSEDPTTYGVSLALMFCVELGDQRTRSRREGWGVAARGDRRSAVSAGRVQEMVKWLIAARPRRDMWTYRATSSNDGCGDISNGSFALLALAAAKRAGVRVAGVDVAELAHVLSEYRTLPANGVPDKVVDTLDVVPTTSASRYWNSIIRSGGVKSIGFGYGTLKCKLRAVLGGVIEASQSTNFNGVASAICLLSLIEPGASSVEVRELRRLISGMATDGLTWAASCLDMRLTGRGRDLHHAYALWSAERALSMAGVEKLSGVDWHSEGATFLLEKQRADGSWRLNGEPLHHVGGVVPIEPTDTALAILFLRRGAKRLLPDVVPQEVEVVDPPTTPR